MTVLHTWASRCHRQSEALKPGGPATGAIPLRRPGVMSGAVWTRHLSIAILWRQNGAGNGPIKRLAAENARKPEADAGRRAADRTGCSFIKRGSDKKEFSELDDYWRRIHGTHARSSQIYSRCGISNWFIV